VGEDVPNFRTISDFRKTHLARLENLFLEVLKLCALAGLARVGTIALDGTKIKANASRHKAMSYDRMKGKRSGSRRRSAGSWPRPRRPTRPRMRRTVATDAVTRLPTSCNGARAGWPRS